MSTDRPKRQDVEPLIDQAFQLLLACHEQQQGATAALAEFRVRSEAHRQAVDAAEQQWRLMGMVELPEQTAIQKSSAFVEHQLISLRDNPRRWVPAAALALLLVVVFPLGGWQALVSEPPQQSPTLAVQPVEQAYQYCRTGHGQQQEFTLPDGSRLYLNWNTEVQWRYSDNQRQLQLVRGEAIFEVAKDSQRPFEVTAGEATFRALGTAFAVRQANEETRIAVTEGVVRAKAQEPAHAILTAHRGLTVRDGKLGKAHTVAVQEITAWRHGMLVFNNRPLIEVLRDLDRYTAYKIETGYLDEPDSEVSATYFIDQIDDALHSLASTFKLESEAITTDGGSVLKVRSTLPDRPFL